MKRMFGIVLVALLSVALVACVENEGIEPPNSKNISPSPPATPKNPPVTPEPVKSPPTDDAPLPITTQASPTPRTEVPWGDYDAGTQSEIDHMTAAGDCNGIQSYFGMATATEESIVALTGHGNEKFVAYLRESLQIAKCG